MVHPPQNLAGGSRDHWNRALEFYPPPPRPGDPAMVYIGEAGGASEETLKAVRKEFGLDESLSEQLFIYGKKLLTGDFGFSYFQGKPVLDLILEKIWATALLVLTAMLMAVVIGVFTGVIVAQRPASPLGPWQVTTGGLSMTPSCA